MAIFFYNIFLWLYKVGIWIASLWNHKAKLWTNGRKNIFQKLKNDLRSVKEPVTWFHCSSLGEFEQGRPIIEKIRLQDPSSKILLTFFSPSGFEIRKNYKGADWVYYLPMDSAVNAKKFLDIARPVLVVFVKYDYWYYYLTECKKRNVRLVMVSAIFRKEQPFFKWYGGLHKKMLRCFTHFFVQDNKSSQLLTSIGINNVTVSGDTRFDRVADIAENFVPIDDIKTFCQHSPVLVAGSTWPNDEKIIKEAVNNFPDLKVILAPHEIHEEHLKQLKSLFQDSVFYSRIQNESPKTRYLIIDNIGMLSRLYYYATIAYVGGGFDKGIHNTLEAAVYGKPVIFGPDYKKFKEAIGLIEAGGGISVNSVDELRSSLDELLSADDKLKIAGKCSLDFVQQNRGATEKIMKMI